MALKKLPQIMKKYKDDLINLKKIQTELINEEILSKIDIKEDKDKKDKKVKI
jgi:hypothetical protein